LDLFWKQLFSYPNHKTSYDNLKIILSWGCHYYQNKLNQV
jgi:hypothetical protein